MQTLCELCSAASRVQHVRIRAIRNHFSQQGAVHVTLVIKEGLPLVIHELCLPVQIKLGHREVNPKWFVHQPVVLWHKAVLVIDKVSIRCAHHTDQVHSLPHLGASCHVGLVKLLWQENKCIRPHALDVQRQVSEAHLLVGHLISKRPQNSLPAVRKRLTTCVAPNISNVPPRLAGDTLSVIRIPTIILSVTTIVLIVIE